NSLADLLSSPHPLVIFVLILLQQLFIVFLIVMRLAWYGAEVYLYTSSGEAEETVSSSPEEEEESGESAP
ncbi:MAG: hypothetical protein D6681_23075, partial [Calditrichaeota bacterium]